MKLKLLDPELLIEEVAKRPVLWDLSLEQNRDKAVKDAAWVSVCQALISDFNEKPDEEKNNLVKGVFLRWRNIRDCFIKICKKEEMSLRKGGPSIRPYIYDRQLQFLMKNFEPRPNGRETLGHMRKRRYSEESDDTEDDSGGLGDAAITDVVTLEESGDHKKGDGSERLDFVPENSGKFWIKMENDKSQNDGERSNETPTVAETPNTRTTHDQDNPQQTPAAMTEDEHFFYSLLPSVSALSRAQKMRFRIEVMQTLLRVQMEDSPNPGGSAGGRC